MDQRGISFMEGNDRGVLLNRKKGGILTDQAPPIWNGLGSGGSGHHDELKLKIFNANHLGGTMHNLQTTDPLDRLLHGLNLGIMHHQDEGHGIALMPFGLNDG
jgi:hypothetical protein